MKNIAKVLIKLALIIVGVLGIIFNFYSTSFMGNGYIFMFFTVQSNLTIILMSFVFLINDILVIFKKKSFVNQFLYHLKYVFTVAITITFLVFFIMLAPTLGVDYLLSFNNFSLHAIVPILAIIDFFIFDKDINITYPSSLLGISMPIYYVIFFLIGIPLGFRYTAEGLKAPYFFLNYEQNGWLFEKGLGVIIWILILTVAISGLCLLFALLMKLRQGKLKKKVNS